MDVYNSIDGALSMEDVGDRAAQRLDESIATNPLFYYGPYTGLIVRNAGFLFGARLLSNHSEEFPRGGHMGKFQSTVSKVSNSLLAAILSLFRSLTLANNHCLSSIKQTKKLSRASGAFLSPQTVPLSTTGAGNASLVTGIASMAITCSVTSIWTC